MDVISADAPDFLRLIFAFTAVLLLMGGLAFVLKKLGLSTTQSMKSGDNRRLKIIESLPLDPRRRLVILKCDDKEHLVILSATSETLIDSKIQTVDDSKDS